MTLYFADTKRWEVRPVEATPFGGCDEDGNPCYENTHFLTEREAIEQLYRAAESQVLLIGRQIVQAREQLRNLELRSAEAAAVVAKITDRWPR